MSNNLEKLDQKSRAPSRRRHNYFSSISTRGFLLIVCAMYSGSSLALTTPLSPPPPQEFCELCQAFHPSTAHIISKALVPVSTFMIAANIIDTRFHCIGTSLITWSPQPSATILSTLAWATEECLYPLGRPISKWCFCSALGGLGPDFSMPCHWDLGICDYYDFVYDCVWRAPVLISLKLRVVRVWDHWKPFCKLWAVFVFLKIHREAWKNSEIYLLLKPEGVHELPLQIDRWNCSLTFKAGLCNQMHFPSPFNFWSRNFADFCHRWYWPIPLKMG